MVTPGVKAAFGPELVEPSGFPSEVLEDLFDEALSLPADCWPVGTALVRSSFFLVPVNVVLVEAFLENGALH